MIVKLPKETMSDFNGYSQLIELYHKLISTNDKSITLSCENATWFEANLSAVLGAIIEMLENDKKDFAITDINANITNVFKRNHFLCEFGARALPDIHDTMIRYKIFNPTSENDFLNYIKNELLSKQDFPRHSKKLGRKISESIFELYENARTHGMCRKIHTCGQYYPKKTPKRLDITIVDMGKTIKANVNEFLNKTLKGNEAIEWALQYGHTTKTGNISGGLGLDIIFEFIKLNEGKVQIVSSDGYWEYRKGRVYTSVFENAFPGTIANIEFNLDDSRAYKWGDEDFSLNDIF